MLGDEDDAATIEKPETAEGDDEPDALEVDARAQGWRPKDEYLKLKGADPEKWVDAKAFLEKGEKSLPIIRDQNRKLTAEMAELRKTVRDAMKMMGEDRDRAVRDALAKLKSEKRDAIAEADPAKVEAIDGQIDKLTKPVPVEKEAAGLPEEFARWGNANPWFKNDSTLRGLAIGHFDLLTAEEPDMSDADKLKAVKVEVMRRYPERFANPNRKNPASVEGANGGGRNGGGKKGYGDLPPEAKELCDKLVRTKVFKTRDEYVALYQF